MLTELDAVNEILRNDGEAPVASLQESGYSEAAAALAALRETSRQCQTRGFAFNVDYERKFTPDLSGEIVLPTNVLWIRPTYTSQALSLVERERKVYDLDNNTFSMTAPVYLDVCELKDFEDLPSYARDYISIKAARKYQARATGSPQQHSFTEADEAMARATMLSADMRARRRGMFRSGNYGRAMIRRPI